MNKNEFLQKLDLLIDLSKTSNNSYMTNNLLDLKGNFYDVLNNELNEQHKAYINLIKNN